MNAKELTLKEVVAELEEKRKWIAAAGFPNVAHAVNDVVCMAMTLIPKYRPPQPSDDGKYCYLEQLPEHGPQRIRLSANGGFWFDNIGAREIQDVTKGVWPCERPERGVT